MIIPSINTKIIYKTPFSDWLSISYATSSSPTNEIFAFFSEFTTVIEVYSKTSESLYRITGGTLKIIHKDEYNNFSFSGSVLAGIRESGHYDDFLRLLASAPYNISRLDIAYDLPIAGSVSVQNIKRLYPDSKCSIASHFRNMQFILSNADVSNREMTGTVYFQTKKYNGTIFLKVYDKAYEMKSKINGIGICDVAPPTTRYELTVKRGASLKDFDSPASCFWRFIPTELLKAPEQYKTSSWLATERIIYDNSDSFDFTEYETFKQLLDNHTVLKILIARSIKVNGGSSLLLQHIQKYIEVHTP
jgi:hypothetical protein